MVATCLEGVVIRGSCLVENVPVACRVSYVFADRRRDVLYDRRWVVRQLANIGRCIVRLPKGVVLPAV